MVASRVKALKMEGMTVVKFASFFKLKMLLLACLLLNWGLGRQAASAFWWLIRLIRSETFFLCRRPYPGL
jgi:hypothetical protein